MSLVFHSIGLEGSRGSLISITTKAFPGDGDVRIHGALVEGIEPLLNSVLIAVWDIAVYLEIPEENLASHSLLIELSTTAPLTGPSFGLPLALSVLCALTNQRVRSGLCYTGEVLESGYIAPVGELPAKARFAKQFGFHELLLPMGNLPVPTAPLLLTPVETLLDAYGKATL